MRETSVLRDIEEVRATKQGYLWIAAVPQRATDVV